MTHQPRASSVLAALLLGGCVATIDVDAQLDTSATAGPVCEPTDPEEHPAVCLDGLDNDCDGLPDCEDPDCQWTMECGGGCEPEEHPMLCFDNSDNDCDGAVDCHDDECADFCAQNGWEPEDHPIVCEDGLDNDGDGLVDCQDPQCQEFCFGFECDPLLQDCPAGMACQPQNDFTCIPSEGRAEGDECDSQEHCAPGLVCIGANALPSCDGVVGCCYPYCDVSDPGAPCPDEAEGVECIPYYEAGMAPPGYESVGLCALPQ